MHSEEVETLDGKTKTVVAGSKEELAQAVEAVKEDHTPLSPDINNPEHGNLIVSEFEAGAGEKFRENMKEVREKEEKEKKEVEASRSAKDGKFVSKDEAKKHPDTTVTEKLKK